MPDRRSGVWPNEWLNEWVCTGRPRSATLACAPASCIVACRARVASWTLPFPSLQPALLTHPVDPHSHGHIINIFGILKGEYNTIQGVIQWPMAYDSKPYAGSAEQCNDRRSDSPMYVSYTDKVGDSTEAPPQPPTLTGGLIPPHAHAM